MAAQRVAQFRALFGNDFLVMPPFYPPNAAELGLSLGAGDMLLPTPDDKIFPKQFLQQAAQVYQGLGRFRTLSLYMDVRGVTPPLRLDLAQLPFTQGERWTGLKFAGQTPPVTPPLPGRQSLLLYSPSNLAPAASDVWTGIVIQDWVEVIPNATETTGPNWTAADVWSTLSETLDLAKIRAVDLELVGGFGQLLPAIFAPYNVDAATGATRFGGKDFTVDVSK